MASISSATSSTTPDYTIGATEAKTEETRTALGKDDFLNLFVTSLQYQDPTSPMDNSQMMAQMAQLGMMEAVENMKSTVETLSESVLGNQLQQGAVLLGKTITGIDANGNTVSGTPEKVQVNDGVVELLMGSKTVELGNISSITN